MKRLLKIVATIIGVLIVLLLLAAVLIPLLVDVNDYKDDIAAEVTDRTGRELEITGDLELSVFPWLRIQLGETRLGNAQGFGPEPFAEIGQAEVGVKLLPLLGGNLEIGRLRLERLQLNLARDATGRNNWDDLTAEPGSVEPTAEPETTTEVSLVGQSVAGIDIRDAGLSWKDASTGQDYQMSGWNLRTGRLALGEPFELSTGLTLNIEESMAVSLDVETTALVDPEKQIYAMTEPRIDIDLSGEAFPEEISLKLSADRIAADLTTQRLDIDRLMAAVLDLELTAQLQGSRITDAPEFQGTLSIDEFSPRGLIEGLSGEPLSTADPKVLEVATVDAAIEATTSRVRLSDLLVKVDDTEISGVFAIEDLEQQSMRFDLAMNAIDLDRYAMGGTDEEDVPAEETEMPLEVMRGLDIDGKLRIGEAVVAGLQFNDVNVRLRAEDGLIRFHPTRAKFYGGTYKGDVKLNVRSETPRLSLDEHVTGVDFAPMALALADSDLLSGRADAHAMLKAKGGKTGDFIRTLGGQIDLELTDGAIEGMDLWYEIRRARALLRQQAIPERTGPKKTPFTEFRGSGMLDGGVMRNDDLIVATQYLRATGAGEVDLSEQLIDYALDVTVLRVPDEDKEDMEDLVDAVIPVSITGSLSSPTVLPDIGAYLSQQAQEAVEEEIEEQKEKLEDKAKKKLKDLFD